MFYYYLKMFDNYLFLKQKNLILCFKRLGDKLKHYLLTQKFYMPCQRTKSHQNKISPMCRMQIKELTELTNSTTKTKEIGGRK
jgi:hypothetical protein